MNSIVAKAQALICLLALALLIGSASRVGAQIIETVAGNGTAGYTGDGGSAVLAQLNKPHGLALDGTGNVLIADTENHVVRRVEVLTGAITTIAGNGLGGFGGDGGPATSAQLFEPTGVAVDGGGNFFIADHSNHRIRMVAAGTGVITTVAGTGAPGYSGDGGLALTAQLQFPTSVVVDAAGVLFVADKNNFVIRKVILTTGIISTVAGTGARGYTGDGGPAAAAQLSDPNGVALDVGGNLFITDADNHVIRRVDAVTQTITTVVGNGTAGFAGDGGPATAAQLDPNNTVAIDTTGNLFIADTTNNRVRKVDASSQVITTLAGTGVAGYAGDGGPATSAQLHFPEGVATDSAGKVLFAEEFNHVIRQVTLSYSAVVQPPINANGSSVFDAKRGVVPVKFTLAVNGTPTCQLPPATISLFRTAGGTLGAINESDYVQPSDVGSNFRVSDCQYIYNLGSSSLGVGTYVVQISIGGSTVGNGTFSLK